MGLGKAAVGILFVSALTAAGLAFVLCPSDEAEQLVRTAGNPKVEYFTDRRGGPPIITTRVRLSRGRASTEPIVHKFESRGWHAEPWTPSLGCESRVLTHPPSVSYWNVEVTACDDYSDVEYSRYATPLERGLHWVKSLFASED